MSSEETRRQLEAISPADIQAMARRLFAPEVLSELVYL
jgi:predicted Zn-dependent peptidase